MNLHELKEFACVDHYGGFWLGAKVFTTKAMEVTKKRGLSPSLSFSHFVNYRRLADALLLCLAFQPYNGLRLQPKAHGFSFLPVTHSWAALGIVGLTFHLQSF
jgi:hypothetical protein